MNNQYIYLKGKLVGPVEMEEPLMPQPWQFHDRNPLNETLNSMAYANALGEYNKLMGTYKDLLALLPSIEVHESLKSKLVENGRYELGRHFVFAKQFIRLIRNIPNVGFDEVVAIPIPESTTAPAPQPERLFTLQEMKECWEDSGNVMRTALFGVLEEKLAEFPEPFQTAYRVLVGHNTSNPFPPIPPETYLKTKFNIDIQ